MKTLVLSAAVLALAATAWMEEAKTDSGKGPDAPVLRRLPPLDASKIASNGGVPWGERDFSDEMHGVFVHVIKDKQDEASKIFWRGAEVSVSLIDPDIKWWHDVVQSPQYHVVYRFRLAPETIGYLVASAEAPGDVRWIALRGIHGVQGFAEGEKLRLIELASRDANPSMRYMAILKAAEYKPAPEAIPIFCRALCDPSLEVSVQACGPLMHYFCPIDDNLKGRPRVSSGSPVAHAELEHAHVLATAKEVHEIRPDLVTDEDLATINSLRESQIADSMKPFEKKPAAKSP